MSKEGYNICVMRGDGIGPQIIDATISLLDSIQQRKHFTLQYTFVPAGDSALKELGDPKRASNSSPTPMLLRKGP